MVAKAPIPISTSPSESKRTTFLFGCANARPRPNDACPPIAGSPRGASRVGLVLTFTQCRPPRPGITIASPRYCWKTLSNSAVWIISNLHRPYRFALAIEAVIFVAYKHSNRPLGLLRLLKSHRNSRGVLVVFHQIIVNAKRIDEALGISGRGILGDTVTGPTPITDHQHHWNVQAQRPAPKRIS